MLPDQRLALQERVDTLLRTYDKPRTSHVANAAACATDPREAWESAIRCNLLPTKFLGDHRRAYASIPTGKTIRSAVWPESPTPPSVQAVQYVGQLATGMMEAEHHARELAQRLAPWKATFNDRIVWAFIDHRPDYVSHLGIPYDSARDMVELALDDYGIDYHVIETIKGHDELPLLLQYGLNAWVCWEVAARRHLQFGGPRWPFNYAESPWKAFVDLPNPFTPILDLWKTGFHLVCVLSEEDPTIRLFAHIPLVSDAEDDSCK